MTTHLQSWETQSPGRCRQPAARRVLFTDAQSNGKVYAPEASRARRLVVNDGGEVAGQAAARRAP
jgi:hypothetical protein